MIAQNERGEQDFIAYFNSIIYKCPVAARDKMREWHDWYAAVNEKWGLERGDDIHETGARHKSLEEHNRELHRENKSLEEELETKRRAVKGPTTMIENLTRRQEEIQSQIAELEAQQQESTPIRRISCAR